MNIGKILTNRAKEFNVLHLHLMKTMIKVKVLKPAVIKTVKYKGPIKHVS